MWKLPLLVFAPALVACGPKAAGTKPTGGTAAAADGGSVQTPGWTDHPHPGHAGHVGSDAMPAEPPEP